MIDWTCADAPNPGIPNPTTTPSQFVKTQGYLSHPTDQLIMQAATNPTLCYYSEFRTGLPDSLVEVLYM